MPKKLSELHNNKLNEKMIFQKKKSSKKDFDRVKNGDISLNVRFMGLVRIK